LQKYYGKKYLGPPWGETSYNLTGFHRFADFMKFNLNFKAQKGFTLVELITVIVILSILAYTALPKFLDIGKDARIASLNGLKGSLISVANMAMAKCIFDTANCSLSAAGGAFPKTSINGVTIYFHYGYPTGWGKFYVDNGVGGVQDLTTILGFTYLQHIPGSFQSVFTKDGAPDPNNCKVIYQMTKNGIPPILTVSTVEEGC
jgi:MSHA pilin protein MshA